MKSAQLLKSMAALAVGAVISWPLLTHAQDTAATGPVPESAAPVETAPAPAATPAPAAQPGLSGLPTISTETGPAAEDPAVSAVLDRLKRDESRISVGDLTAAQDTVARLDLLLQIEQKLGDIDKARANRGMAALLPPGGASTENIPLGDASLPIPSDISQAMTPSASGAKSFSSEEYNVARIAGRQGVYTATLTGSDGKPVTVRVGDSLPDGYKVESISASGVRLTSKSGNRKLLPLSGG